MASTEDEVRPSDLLVIVNTSGATATPKSVMHTNALLIRHACVMAELRKYEPSDCIFTAAPLFWVGGLTMALLAAMASGASVVLQERFEPRSALDLDRRGTSHSDLVLASCRSGDGGTLELC